MMESFLLDTYADIYHAFLPTAFPSVQLFCLIALGILDTVDLRIDGRLKSKNRLLGECLRIAFEQLVMSSHQ